MNRFEAVAFEHVTGHRGRVVKMIGDEVMFINDDPSGAVDTGLALAEAHIRGDLPCHVRVGIAFGTLLSLQGDYFGPCVNLASRAANVAAPATVLVAEPLRDRLAEEPRFRFRGLPVRHLKGIGSVGLWAAERRHSRTSPAAATTGGR